MKNPSLSSRPPQPSNDLEKVKEDFIAGKEVPVPKKPTGPPMYPWEANHVRKDVKKLFSLRLPEPEMLKLHYINQCTGRSMHQFCLDVLLPAIEAEVARLTQND